MIAALRGGVAYGLAVFAVGFVLGTVRVLLVAPATGDALAVALEIPVMLFAASLIAPRSIRTPPRCHKPKQMSRQIACSHPLARGNEALLQPCNAPAPPVVG